MIKKFLYLLVVMPLFNFAQIESAYKEMMVDKTKSFEIYQNLLLDASKYLISNPINEKSSEYVAASNVVTYWMNNQEMGLIIPVKSKFYKSLDAKQNQIVYSAAMIHYFLDQRLNQGVLLMGLEIPGEKLENQVDFKKIQLEGTKTFLNLADDSNNNITLSKDATKYLEAMKKNKLEKMQF